ncbi:Glycoside hydrolase [Apiospora saccharicola]|uniref:Glycoside hydrolase n=1 Tax=Apiospora saccharicola TaxID=335842 RepID=A0ABR1WFA5_9PEZI
MLSVTRVLGLLALLSSSALAALMQHLQGTQYEDKCTYTTWIDETTNNSPLADDCLAIAKPFQNAHQGWFLGRLARHLRIRGTPDNQGGKTNFFFGATDAYDLIFDATMRFRKKSGKFGASGVTKCDDTQVNWKIFHKT